MNPHDQAKLDAIERDRKRREDELLLALLLLWDGEVELPDGSVLRRRENARADVTVALRHGLPYLDILNNFGRQATNAVVGAMADAYRDGVRRMAVLADETIPQSGPPLAAWKDENAATINTLRTAFRQQAQDATDAMVSSIGDALDKYVPSVIRRPQSPELKGAVREAFDTAGYTALHPFALDTGTERAIVTAHNDGMLHGGRARQLVITGLRHLSVLDSVTTEICRERDGLMYPLDDPYWLSNVPALHWNCRSAILPIFNDFTPSDHYPITQPKPGFGMASAVFIQRLKGFGGLAA